MLNPVRFGAYFKLDYQQVDKKPDKEQGAALADLLLDMGSQEQTASNLSTLLYQAGIKSRTVQAFDPVTTQQAEYLVVDDAKDQSLTELNALEAGLWQMARAKFDGDRKSARVFGDFHSRAGEAEVAVGMAFILPMQGKITAQTPVLTVKRTSGINAALQNGSEVLAQVQQAIS